MTAPDIAEFLHDYADLRCSGGDDPAERAAFLDRKADLFTRMANKATRGRPASYTDACRAGPTDGHRRPHRGTSDRPPAAGGATSQEKYRLPFTGELVPLLQIAPSKTDTERLLLVSPELADVLSAIIQPLRKPDGPILLVVSHDVREKIWNPPMPLQFQGGIGNEPPHIHALGFRKLLMNDVAMHSTRQGSSAGTARTGSRSSRYRACPDAAPSSPVPITLQMSASSRGDTLYVWHATPRPSRPGDLMFAGIATRRGGADGSRYPPPT